MDDAEKKQRIKLWMAWIMLISALVVDLIELGLTYTGIGIIFAELLAICASLVFWIWFLVLGVSYSSNTKRFMTSIIMYIGELVPGLDAVPFWFLWTFGMLFIIMLTRMEDRGEEPTILGAFKRIGAWASVPAGVGIPLVLNIKHHDMQRVKRQKTEREHRNLEIAENPDNADEIKAKYAKRERIFKRKELSRPERLERRFFKVGKEGVSLREGRTIDEAKESFSKFGQKQTSKYNNVLDLKNGKSTKKGL